MSSSENNPSITFVGGARSVTGSNFLMEFPEGGRTVRILVDCGLLQGARFCEPYNREPFPYDPATIDAVFVTHAHADHIGLLPKLVKEGYEGPIYTTAATAELIPIMLEDSVTLVSREAKHCGDEAPYTKEEVALVGKYLSVVPYEKKVQVSQSVAVSLHNAGHIIGSATVLVEGGGKRTLFTGDLGRRNATLVPERSIPEGPIDYLVTESVYGGRAHEPEDESLAVLRASVERIHKTKGALLIPAFSLERTQIILAALDRMIADGEIESLPVYIDSPLAIKVTEVYRNNPDFLREEVRARLEGGDDPFSFPSLVVSRTAEDSQEAINAAGPKVVIAGAGMSHGGRIRSHEAAFLPDPNSMLLLVGYQTPGSLGRRLKDGAKRVTINGQQVWVKAKVSSVAGFSAHADRDDLLSFAEDVNPQKAFVVLGEMEQSAFLAQRLSGFLGIEATIPQKGERFLI